MTVASKELCEELFTLSVWHDTYWAWFRGLGGEEGAFTAQNSDSSNQLYPAYDLGYLLRKVPSNHVDISRVELHDGVWCAEWYCAPGRQSTARADTPEDAVAQLLINLFKLGFILKEAK